VSQIEHYWPCEDYAGIRVNASRCNIQIEGTSDNRIKFESNLDNKSSRELSIDSSERWLSFDLLRLHNDSKINLKLPESKLWTMLISISKGDITIRNTQGRWQVIQGNGSLQIENCRGVLTALTGKSEIKIKYFQQIAVPEIPPLARKLEYSENSVDGKDAIPLKEVDWKNWGEELGDKFKGWVLNSNRFWGSGSANSKDWGLYLKVIRGDIQIENSQFHDCSVTSYKGSLKIEKGLAGYLETNLKRGNIEIATSLSVADWDLKTHRGDIRLKLDSKASVRMDMATRFGDIHSEIPLVRVARQGPCSFHSNRMVGILGQDNGEKIAVLHISTIHGDIEIKSQPSDIEFAYADSTHSSALNNYTTFKERYKTSMEVLQALSEKRISIEEADRVLREMSSKVSE